MSDFEFGLLALAILGLILGSWGIFWARVCRRRGLVVAGRSLFLVTLLFMGAGCLVAAFHRAHGLVPLGLSAGLLVVLMLWEVPHTAWHE
jgi:hypothetical protein